MGTVGYMSPEQIRAADLDARSDLFSFGCILYEMLTGKRPFTGKVAAETITSILEEEPPPISQTVKDLPPGLNETIHRCLEKKPEDRFQSAREVAFDLKKVLDGSAIQITSPKAFRFTFASPNDLGSRYFGFTACCRIDCNVSASFERHAFECNFTYYQHKQGS